MTETFILPIKKLRRLSHEKDADKFSRRYYFEEIRIYHGVSVGLSILQSFATASTS